MSSWYCPHCAMAIADDGATETYPPRPERCPCCSLVIGAHRAHRTPSAAAGERAHGSAANVLSSRARRSEDPAGDPDAVLAAIRRVAERVGCHPPRLRMLDYSRAAQESDDLPSLGCVLSTFGAWKIAARSAARRGAQVAT